MPASTPDRCPGSVATPPSDVPVYCPICETVPLHGKQTVCSAKCRIQKSMQTRAAKRAERDAKVRLLLAAALTVPETTQIRQRITEALELLELETGPSP
jgi:predicted nucleic acid-binding Zn ribbon protein